jgi:hypothetical protein
MAEIGEMQRYPLCWRNNLHGCAVDKRKNSAQRFVASDDLVERLLQRVEIQITGESARVRTIINPTLGFQLVQKP